jgi:hypothetical protein
MKKILIVEDDEVQDILRPVLRAALSRADRLLHLDRLIADACGTEALKPASVTAR